MASCALVVSLLTGLLSVRGQNFGLPPFPSGLSGLGPVNPYAQFGHVLNQQQQQQQQQEDVLTCINSDPQDPSSLIRLTITDHDAMRQRPMMMYGRQNDNERARDWQINGYYKPSTLNPVSGSFQVVVTQYGRVNDGCNSAAMGPAVTSLTPFPQAFLTPFYNLGAGVGRRAGHLHNPLYVTRGGLTMYSATMRGVSRSQLLGGGVAVCPQVDDKGQCYGAVLQCCTVARDQLHASQVYLNPAQQNGGNVLAFPGSGGNNFNPAFGSVPLVGGALGTSAPFQIDSGDFLAFSDLGATALLASSSDTKSRQQQSSAASETSAAESSSDTTATTGLF